MTMKNAQRQIRAPDYKECLTEKNILRFIDIAEETKSTDCLLWLMDYKKEKFPN